MDTQTMIPVDFWIGAVVAAIATYFICRNKHGDILSALFGGIAAVACVFAGVIINDNFINISESNEKIFTLLYWVVGGLLAAINAVIFNERAKAQVETAKAQTTNNELTEKGHIRERFKTATEHLGDSSPSVQIAAYYEFYQLAEDNKNLRKSIFEILCAHLREITNADNYADKEKPTEGVQTLLDLLFKPERKFIFQELKANLQRVHLVGADLSNADIEGALLSNANLKGANLHNANLKNAHSIDANFESARLLDTNLKHARMWKINLKNATLYNANLNNAWLYEAHMPGAFLSNACLTNAYFYSANLHNCYFNDAVMDGADLNRATMVGADLTNTRLRGAFLQNTNMQMATIDGADFRGARMHNTKMQGVSISKNKPPLMGGVFHEDGRDKYVEQVRKQQNKQGSISGIIYSGGIASPSTVENIADFLSKHVDSKFSPSLDFKYSEAYTDSMQKHIDQEKNAEEWEYASNINLDAYSSADADEWVAEYKKATGNASDKNSD